MISRGDCSVAVVAAVSPPFSAVTEWVLRMYQYRVFSRISLRVAKKSGSEFGREEVMDCMR